MRNILALLLFIYISFTSIKARLGYVPIIEKNPNKEVSKKQEPTTSNDLENNVNQQTNKVEEKNDDLQNKINQETELEKKENNLYRKSEQATNINPQKEKEYNHQGTYSERFVSNVVTNLLKTDEGQKFFSKLITPIGAPKIDKPLKINEANSLDNIFASKIIEEGIGEKTVNCGDDVSIAYYIYDIADKLILTKEVDIKIGSNQVIPIAMENMVIGMRENQKKSSLINRDIIDKIDGAEELPKNNSTKIRIEILLNKINRSESRISKNDIIYFDDAIAPIQKFCLCGEFVEIVFEVYSMENKLLFKDNLRFRIGDKNIPDIINSAIIGLTYNVNRTIIAKAKEIDSIKNYKKDFGLDVNNNDYIRIRMSLI